MSIIKHVIILLLYAAVSVGGGAAKVVADEPKRTVELIDFTYKGKDVRSIWTAVEHPDGLTTIVCQYWPRNNQLLVDANSFTGYLAKDTIGTHILCFSFKDGIRFEERIYLKIDKTTPFGFQIASSMVEGSRDSIKSVGRIVWPDAYLGLNRSWQDLHISLAKIVQKQAALNKHVNTISTEAQRAYIRMMLESAKGWNTFTDK